MVRSTPYRFLLFPTVKVPNGTSRVSPACATRIHFDISKYLGPGLHAGTAGGLDEVLVACTGAFHFWPRRRQGRGARHVQGTGDVGVPRRAHVAQGSAPPRLLRRLHESQRLNCAMPGAVAFNFPSI